MASRSGARVRERLGLFGVDADQVDEFRLAERLAHQPGGGHVPRDERPAPGERLTDGANEGGVQLRHLLAQSVHPQVARVRQEGGGVDHVAARVGIAARDGGDRLRVFQRPLLDADAGGHPRLHELGARRAVEQQRQA